MLVKLPERMRRPGRWRGHWHPDRRLYYHRGPGWLMIMPRLVAITVVHSVMRVTVRMIAGAVMAIELVTGRSSHFMMGVTGAAHGEQCQDATEHTEQFYRCFHKSIFFLFAGEIRLPAVTNRTLMFYGRDWQFRGNHRSRSSAAGGVNQPAGDGYLPPAAPSAWNDPAA